MARGLRSGFFMGEGTQERMDLWLIRALVLLSFAAHLTLALLAGIRRRRHSGLQRSLVWLAYHVTEIATSIALGKVFLDTATTNSEQQMFALWAPFLLLHLGRPDNITSYALENKGLSPTQKAVLVLEIGGAIYGSYKQRFMRGDGALRAAFFIMLFLGSYKCVERAVALHRASFANIRRSNERKRLHHFSSIEDRGRKRYIDGALLDAHGLLGVTMGAFAGYQVDHRTNYKGFYSGWKDVSKVVEMEASLMYDMLYTKASVIHTWPGYIIRVLSPPATAMALYLYHIKDGQALESADRTATYTLLVGTLVLDVIWLPSALGCSWTYVFLVDREQREEESRLVCRRRRNLWGNSQLLGRLKKAGRRVAMQSWYWLRRILVSLDLSRLPLRSGSSGHRLLPASGVGQRNLLQECSTPPQGRLDKMVSYFFAGIGKKIDVKDELLEAMCTHVLLEPGTRTWRRPTKELNDYMGSNREHYSFESNLIAFHLATNIFLLCKPTWIESEASAKYEKQIRALSDYMMFLLAQRKHMVLKPGDEGSDYKKCCLDLTEIWYLRGTSGSPTARATRLANTLLFMDVTHGSNRKSSLLSNRNKTLSLGADWALRLLHELDPTRYDSGRDPMSVGYVHRLEDFILVFTDEAQTNIKRYRDSGEQWELLDYMLKLILDSWVRFLSFTSQECSRESHAKQLSCGGEFLTIVWLMKQHGGALNLISKGE